MILTLLRMVLILGCVRILYNMGKHTAMERRGIIEPSALCVGDGSFTLSKPENVSYLYFPLASETGMKSSVTPNLGGDAKLDQETFLLEPVSAENLHNNRSGAQFLAGRAGRRSLFWRQGPRPGRRPPASRPPRTTAR